MNSNINVIINIVLGVLLITGGWVFSKRSKSSEQVKRNVSLGAYLLGGLALVFHLPNLWRVINGTYESRSISLNVSTSPATPNLADVAVSSTSTQMVELFGTYINLFHLINVGAGLGIIVIGLMFKEKNWSKYAMLLGVATIVSGAVQIIL